MTPHPSTPDLPELRGKEEEMTSEKRKPLSARAQKLLGRLQRGKFYEAYGNNTPQAMHELIKAGLVSIAGRPVVVGAYYVPASGFRPYRPERFDRAISASEPALGSVGGGDE